MKERGPDNGPLPQQRDDGPRSGQPVVVRAKFPAAQA